MFNHIDIGVLETLGFTILETPDAFQKMTRETFLFDPHLEWKHTARALDVAHPCLRIGNMIPIDVSWYVSCQHDFVVLGLVVVIVVVVKANGPMREANSIPKQFHTYDVPGERVHTTLQQRPCPNGNPRSS